MLIDHKCEWMSAVSYKTLPKIGYIAMIGTQPVAAGFLRRVEGGYAQLDTFVTNPWFGSQVRHEGIELVVDALLGEAKELNLLGIIAITKDSGILSRAKERGFVVVEQSIISKSL